eukprot:jgi/Astpho2/1329/e_gw1.00024.15.1_t
MQLWRPRWQQGYRFARSGRATTCRAATTATRPEQDLGRRSAQLRDLVQDIASTAAQSGPRGLFRGLQVADAVSRITREYLRSVVTGNPEAAPTVLRKLFERLGATYIKASSLGQFIASSPTLFPKEYVTEFQKCLDQTDPIPWATIRKTIQTELGQPLEDVFVRVDPTPLACASVAQARLLCVHAAVLRGSNKEVVIKVLKPGVQDVLTTDLDFILTASKVLEFLNPDLARTSLVGIISDVRQSMMEETNFQKEAQHIQQFQSYLERSGMQAAATCPYVYKQHSTTSILVMERLYGVPLTDLAAIRSMTTADPELTLIRALNTWFGSVMGAETFHADVHAGNLLVLRDGRIGFIDFGIVGSINPVTWTAVESFLTSTMTADFDTMARALVTMGVTEATVDVAAFSRDLQQVFTEIESMDVEALVGVGPNGSTVAATMAVDDARVNGLLLKARTFGETHGIRFPREFGLLLKQLLYFDRYTRELAPSLSVLRDDRVKLRPQEEGPVVDVF